MGDVLSLEERKADVIAALIKKSIITHGRIYVAEDGRRFFGCASSNAGEVLRRAGYRNVPVLSQTDIERMPLVLVDGRYEKHTEAPLKKCILGQWL